jgi:release factor glutamine methyltransferase
MITWEALAAEVAGRLGTSGIEGADRNARLIVEKASGTEPGEWVTRCRQPATRRGVAAVDAMTARREGGEPLQYVLAGWGFRHLDLYLDRRVLIPRPETEVVAGAALAELERLAPAGRSIRAADLGTGSGAIGLALATEHRGVEMWLTDASATALEVARANLAGAGSIGGRVRIVEGSWFEALPPELAGTFGLIVSNPPYVAEGDQLPAEVAEWEPRSALIAGPAGTEQLEHLVVEAPRWLRPDGSLVLEMAPGQTGTIAALAARRFGTVSVEADLTGRGRMVIARRGRSVVG